MVDRPKWKDSGNRIIGAIGALAWLAVVMGMTRTALGASPPTGELDAVVVTVNDTSIRERDVQRVVRRVPGVGELSEEARRRLERSVAEALVEQELARQYLRTSRWGATEAEVEPRRRKIEQNLRARGISLEAHLRSIERDEASWRRELHWKLAWQRYREQFVTDDNLRKQFERHRRDYDGTRRRVAQIWWPLAGRSGTERKRVLQEAAEVRRQLIAGKLSFEEAAKKYSRAPSGKRGGEVGWIERHAPMPEPFSKAAFAMEVGAVSPLVVTPRGVHLIRCLEEQPGRRTWEDVRAELRRDVERFLRGWLADQARKTARIEWHGRYASGASSDSTSRIM